MDRFFMLQYRRLIAAGTLLGICLTGAAAVAATATAPSAMQSTGAVQSAVRNIRDQTQRDLLYREHLRHEQQHRDYSDHRRLTRFERH